MLHSQQQNLAAIDIGTSSVHLAVARPCVGGRPEILLRHKVPVRLGSGAKDMKSLDPAAIDRAILALRDFKAQADSQNAEIHAVATSAVREAQDRKVFLNRAAEEAGIAVEVIAGPEEARLIHLGVLGALPISDRRHLVIDIGGGSTELVVGHGLEPELLRSFKLGHVRLTDRFFPGGDVKQSSIDSCRTFIRSFLARAAVTIHEAGVDIVAGSSGTFETVARLASVSDPTSEPVTVSAVRAITADLIATRLASPTALIPDVDDHRQDTILAGALLVEGLMDTLEIGEFVVSPDSLREGLVLDRLSRRDRPGGASSLSHLGSIRAHSVEAVAVRYGENLTHARQATAIALNLFDATTPLHGLGEEQRDILEASAMMHNVGRFVGHSAHHRHSYYLIRNSEQLAGFNERERDLMAQVARYHRKSAPKLTHQAFESLSNFDRQTVRVLAGMLRIGIALDRTYRSAAQHVQVNATGEALEVLVTGDDLELEFFAANERKGLLEESLGVTISFAAVEAVNEQIA